MFSRIKLKSLRYLASVAVAGWLSLAGALNANGQTIADDLDRESLRIALRRSIGYLEKLPRERIVGTTPRRFSAGAVLDSLRAFEGLLKHWACWPCFLKELHRRFEIIPSSSDPESESVLFTGYYQPIIAASLTETEEFRFPLYAVPADLGAPRAEMERVDGEPNASYFSRREIDQAGALRGRGLEIAWVKDPIDIFFLQIQGSGILQLDDGRKLQIGYAAQNGRPYRSIGRLLIEQGMVASEEMSMQRLRRYLTERPQERDEIFFHNESYVFFRLLSVGPLGSLEVPLTPGRSLATDARLFPKAALAFIVTETPVIDTSGELSGWQPLSRFVLNQDTGGAIRGLQRGDIFFGSGPQATDEAGLMNRQGKLFFLMLKGRTAPMR